MDSPIFSFKDVVIFSLKPEEYADLYNTDDAKINFVIKLLNYKSHTPGKKLTVHIYFPIDE